MIFTSKQKNSKSKSMNLHIGHLVQWIRRVLLLLEILLDLVELLCELFLLLFLLFLLGTKLIFPFFSLFFGLVSVSLLGDDLDLWYFWRSFFLIFIIFFSWLLFLGLLDNWQIAGDNGSFLVEWDNIVFRTIRWEIFFLSVHIYLLLQIILKGFSQNMILFIG